MHKTQDRRELRIFGEYQNQKVEEFRYLQFVNSSNKGIQAISAFVWTWPVRPRVRGHRSSPPHVAPPTHPLLHSPVWVNRVSQFTEKRQPHHAHSSGIGAGILSIVLLNSRDRSLAIHLAWPKTLSKPTTNRREFATHAPSAHSLAGSSSVRAFWHWIITVGTRH